jgi:5-methyltetrahydropteroyltriglutamate--homocysteine methyltransferase
MPHYPPYATTVVGAHSVPRWHEAPDRLVTMGQLSPGDIGDAQFRAMQGAILEQEIAGIDVITGGEMHRRTHNCHSPPNAMLNHFWDKIPAFHVRSQARGGSQGSPTPPARCEGPQRLGCCLERTISGGEQRTRAKQTERARFGRVPRLNVLQAGAV